MSDAMKEELKGTLTDFFNEMCDKFDIPEQKINADVASPAKQLRTEEVFFEDAKTGNTPVATESIKPEEDELSVSGLEAIEDVLPDEDDFAEPETVKETAQSDVVNSDVNVALENTSNSTLIIKSAINPFAYADNKDIKYVFISCPASNIGAYAFINCANIEVVAIETTEDFTDDQLKALFKGCDKLKEILINNKLFKMD